MAEQDDEALLSPGYLVNGEYEIQSISERRSPWISYRAQHLTRKTEFARVFTLCDYSADPRCIDALARYGDWLKTARIPTMPGFLGVCVEAGLPVVLTSWIEGPTLAASLEGAPALPKEEVLRLLRAIAESLDLMHAQRPVVVHQLLSMHTIVLEGATKQPRLLDCGLAQSMRNARLEDVTKQSHVDGCFVAPEDLPGKIPSPSVDRYALGRLAQTLLGTVPPGSPTDKVLQRAIAQSVMTRFTSCSSFVQALNIAIRDTKPATISAGAIVSPVQKTEDKPTTKPLVSQSVHDAPTRQVIAPPPDASLREEPVAKLPESKNVAAKTPEKKPQPKPTAPKLPPKTLIGLAPFKEHALQSNVPDAHEPQLEVSDSWADIDQLQPASAASSESRSSSDAVEPELSLDEPALAMDPLFDVVAPSTVDSLVALEPNPSLPTPEPEPESEPELALSQADDDAPVVESDESLLDLPAIVQPKSKPKQTPVADTKADVTPASAEPAIAVPVESAAIEQTSAASVPVDDEVEIAVEPPEDSGFGHKESVAEIDEFERRFGIPEQKENAKVVDVPPLFEVGVLPPEPIEPVQVLTEKSKAKPRARGWFSPTVGLVSVSGLVVGAALMVAVDRQMGLSSTAREQGVRQVIVNQSDVIQTISNSSPVDSSTQLSNGQAALPAVIEVTADAGVVPTDSDPVLMVDAPELVQQANTAIEDVSSVVAVAVEEDVPSQMAVNSLEERDVPNAGENNANIANNVNVVDPVAGDGPIVVPGPSGLSQPDWHIRGAARRLVRLAVEPCGQGRHPVARIFVRFTGATGALETVSVVGPLFQDTPLGACVEHAMRRIQLPTFRDAHWDTDYAVTLR